MKLHIESTPQQVLITSISESGRKRPLCYSVNDAQTVIKDIYFYKVQPDTELVFRGIERVQDILSNEVVGKLDGAVRRVGFHHCGPLASVRLPAGIEELTLSGIARPYPSFPNSLKKLNVESWEALLYPPQVPAGCVVCDMQGSPVAPIGQRPDIGPRHWTPIGDGSGNWLDALARSASPVLDPADASVRRRFNEPAKEAHALPIVYLMQTQPALKWRDALDANRAKRRQPQQRANVP